MKVKSIEEIPNEEKTEREVIVMVHGMWCGEWVWENYKNFFQEKNFICISPNLSYHRAYLRQPHPKLGLVSLLDYAEELEEIIVAIEKNYGKPPIIMGHSMGGLLAQILASRGLGKGLILLAPAAPRWINSIEPSVLDFFMPTLMNAKTFWKKPLKPSFKNISENMLYKIPEGQHLQIYNKMCHESGRAVFEIGFWSLEWRRRAAKVKYRNIKDCPIFVAVGEEDKITPAVVVEKNVKKFEKHCSSSVTDFRIYPQYSHWLLAEPGWERLANDVHSWLQNLTKIEKGVS